jgi:hypothetical protein
MELLADEDAPIRYVKRYKCQRCGWIAQSSAACQSHSKRIIPCRALEGWPEAKEAEFASVLVPKDALVPKRPRKSPSAKDDDTTITQVVSDESKAFQQALALIYNTCPVPDIPAGIEVLDCKVLNHMAALMYKSAPFPLLALPTSHEQPEWKKLQDLTVAAAELLDESINIPESNAYCTPPKDIHCKLDNLATVLCDILQNDTGSAESNAIIKNVGSWLISQNI